MRIKNYVRQSVLLAIGLGYDKIWRDLNQQLRKEHCSLLQALILISIFFERDEAVTPSNLAEAFQTTRANVSQSITRLEREGYLKRVLSENDARSYQLVLRPEGKKLALRLMKLINGLEDHFEDRLGKKFVSDTVDALHLLKTTYEDRV